MKTRLLVAGVAALTLGGADAASAFISANTIDGHATHTSGGARVRATGPIGCTADEHVAVRVTVSQAATGAQARKTWKRRCTGEIQHWQVRARAHQGTRFATEAGRACAAAETRAAGRLTDTRKWCERVSVSGRF